jgi:hypothetical protein
MAAMKLRPNPSRPAPLPRGRPPLNEIERRHILDATTAVFLEKGFLRAGTDEIARRVVDEPSRLPLLGGLPARIDGHGAGGLRRRGGSKSRPAGSTSGHLNSGFALTPHPTDSNSMQKHVKTRPKLHSKQCLSPV